MRMTCTGPLIFVLSGGWGCQNGRGLLFAGCFLRAATCTGVSGRECWAALGWAGQIWRWTDLEVAGNGCEPVVFPVVFPVVWAAWPYRGACVERAWCEQPYRQLVTRCPPWQDSPLLSQASRRAASQDTNKPRTSHGQSMIIHDNPRPSTDVKWGVLLRQHWWLIDMQRYVYTCNTVYNHATHWSASHNKLLLTLKLTPQLIQSASWSQSLNVCI